MIFPKLKVKGPKMAHHDLSHYFRTSMAVGTKTPILCRPFTVGDDVMLDFESLVNTQALLSPLYGSYKLVIEAYMAYNSLYIPRLWRNGSMRNSQGILDANYPYFLLSGNDAIPTGGTAKMVDSSSLMAYLGLPPGYAPNLPMDSGKSDRINAIPLLMYYDIARNYWLNRQETVYPVCGDSLTGDTLPCALSELDNLFENLPVDGGDITSLLTSKGGVYALQNYDKALAGLICGTYLPDRMNVILNRDFCEKNISTVQVSTAGNSFQVDQLVTAKKLWNSRNKDAMTSGTFKDWIRSHYGVTPHIMDDMPTFLGATSSEIVFEDIRATTFAQGTNENGDGIEQYLGDKASSAKGYLRSRRFRLIADRPGYLMVVASIIPRVDYSQGLKRYVKHMKLSDTFRPEFNGIGLQDVLYSDLNCDYHGFKYQSSTIPVKDPTTYSAGKQPAWIEYMTAENEVRGTFCTTESSWVLRRDMHTLLHNDTSGPVGNTQTTAYIHPRMWNQPFAVQSPSVQNFLVQFYIKDQVRSTVLKRLLPQF